MTLLTRSVRGAQRLAFVIGSLLSMLGAPRAAHAQARADALPARSSGTAFRTLSWNVSYRRFMQQQAEFQAMVRAADPDIFILDEVSTAATTDDLRTALRGLRGPADTIWHIVKGAGGGYQHGAIASRQPVTLLSEFEMLTYPDSAIAQIVALTPDSSKVSVVDNMRTGVGVTGALVKQGDRTLMVLSVDFVCCGKDADSAQELRRRIEAREIRAALQRAMRAHPVDGMIVAGDFNLVNGATPLGIITQPYPAPHFALAAAEPMHLDGREVWTWDGRESPFAMSVLDWVLFGPVALESLRATPFSTEDLTPEQLARYGLTADMTRKFSEHLPVIADFRWRAK